MIDEGIIYSMNKNCTVHVVLFNQKQTYDCLGYYGFGYYRHEWWLVANLANSIK